MLTLILNRYVYTALGATVLSLIMFLAGDIHGKSVEKNSLENIQRAAIIVNQNRAIDVLQKDKQIQDKSIIDLQVANDKLAEHDKKLQEQIKKDENIINRTNTINGYFLRIIQDAASGNSVPKGTTSSGRANDPTKTYKPSDVDASIADGFGQCNRIRNQLIELQNVIRKMVENANR